MSPALIDPGLQSHSLGLGGPRATSLAQILINSSGGLAFQGSAFAPMNKSDCGNPNFQFSAASSSKPLHDKPAFASVHGLSRPRMAKTRKSQHNRAMGGPQPRESMFHRAADGSSMFEANRVTSGSNATPLLNLDTSILDEMSKLRLRDEEGSLSSEPYRLNAEHTMQREDSISFETHFNVIGVSENDTGFGRSGDCGGYSSLLTDLPSDLKNLNIKDLGMSGGNGSVMDDAKEQTKPYNENVTPFSNNKSEGRHFRSEPHSIILDGLGNLKLGDELKEPNNNTGPGKASSQTAVPPYGVDILLEGLKGFGINSPRHQANDESQSTHQLVFTSKLDSSATPYRDFSALNPLGTSFTSFNQKVEFGARREPAKGYISEKLETKSKESSTFAQPWEGVTTLPQESNYKYEPSDSYSPMDISPYPEIVPDDQFSTETSLTSDKVAHIEDDLTSKECQSACGGTVDKDLISATEHLGINKCKDTNFFGGPDHVSTCSFNEIVTAQASSEESTCAVETQSFKSENDYSDISGQNEEVSSRFNDEAQSRDSDTHFYSALSSESSREVSFTFSASSTFKDQVAPVICNQKKKNRTKVGQDPYHSLKDTLLSEASSTIHFSSFSRGSSPFNSKKEGIYHNNRKEGPSLYVEKAQPAKQETLCPSATDSAAKEACEKWRLRGNQAYSHGEFEKAEDCYTKGVNCISKGEASGDGRRALMLCYSNRAAICMTLGRFRDALADCRAAAKIDPNFYKVQVRTANCYLALGEVVEASQLVKLLHIGSEAWSDSKLNMEVSEIIQKVQEVSLCIDHSAELLRHKTMNNAESSLQVIDEGLAISPCSEKLLQMKADALFMMRRYLEVIQHCQRTLLPAEKNFPLLLSNQSVNVEPCDLLKNYAFRVWRYSFIFISYYYLGKLEEGLDFLENKEDLRSMMDRCGTQVESLIPLLVPAREMLKHKSAGNSAYLAGKHAEAVEHYTAALACKPESRPFASVCFGNRAAAYQALGQILDAIADCNLAISLDRNYLKAISRRATLFEMIRDYREAAKDLQKLVSLITKQAEGKNNQSTATERPSNARAELRNAHMRLSHVEEQAVKELVLDYYLILGVEQSASSAGLKKAYRKAALRHHPDKACQGLTRGENVDDTLWKEMSEEVQKESDRLFKMIGEVYSVLSDPYKRLRYDEEVKNALQKAGAMGGSRMHSDGQSCYGNTRSSSSGRSAWKSPANSPSYWYEPSSRSTRFF